jgi:flagellar biosynthesis GTPase FlhF
MHYDVPISYTTFGQRVPEDMSKLDAREIAASVFRESHRYLPKAAVEERGLSWQMLAGVHA